MRPDDPYSVTPTPPALSPDGRKRRRRARSGGDCRVAVLPCVTDSGTGSRARGGLGGSDGLGALGESVGGARSRLPGVFARWEKGGRRRCRRRRPGLHDGRGDSAAPDGLLAVLRA